MERTSPLNVRATREALGMTIDALAACLRVSTRTISRWEAGVTSPHAVYVQRIRAMLIDKEMHP